MGNPESTGVSKAFFGVRYPRGQIIEADEPQLGKVVDSKSDALALVKAVKGSRFKRCDNEQEAKKFVEEEEEGEDASRENNGQTNGIAGAAEAASKAAPPSEGCSFPSLTPQQMKLLKDAISVRDEAKICKMVEENPRYLVTTSDTPAIMHSGTRSNAMHVAAASQSLKMVALMLSKIQDPGLLERMYPNEAAESRARRLEHLLDLYLNMPNKGMNNTPLHIASSYGAVDIVRLLVGFSSCNTLALNKHGHTPAEVACTKMGDYDADVKEQIGKALEGQVYIPVFRDCNLYEPGYLGDTLQPGNDIVPRCLGNLNPLLHSPVPGWRSPRHSPSKTPPATRRRLSGVTPPKSPLLLRSPAAGGSPTTSSPLTAATQNNLLSVRAFLGPLSPNDANQVRNEWQRSTPRSLKLTDPEKGLERQGRKVAREHNSSLFEYWEFLDSYCDLSSTDGLRMLDNHLHDTATSIRQAEVDDSDEDQLNGNNFTPASSDPDNVVLSPLSQLVNDMDRLKISSTPVDAPTDNVGGGVNGNDDDFFSVADSESETSFRTAEEDPLGDVMVYVQGSAPTVADLQVYAALNDSGVTQECLNGTFPNVATWMDRVRRAGSEEKKSWRRQSATVASCRISGQLVKKTLDFADAKDDDEEGGL